MIYFVTLSQYLKVKSVHWKSKIRSTNRSTTFTGSI